MKGSFRKNLHKAFLFSIVLLFCSSIASFVAIQQSNNSAKWVNHTEKVKESLEQLISTMKDAETGVRGYLITGDPETLEPYTGSYKRTIISFNSIKQLTRDNEQQQKSLTELLPVIELKFRMLEAQVKKKNDGQTIGASDVHKGKQVMDKARRLIKIMQNREEELLHERESLWNKYRTFTPFLILIIAAIATITSYYFCSKLKKAYYSNMKLQQALQRKNIETDKRITIIQQVADKISLGNYEVRIQEEDSDILGNLATNMNRMAESLEYSFNTLKELMLKKDDFISIAAHELKTPLTSIKAYLQFIGRVKLEHDEARKVYPFVSKANVQVNRLTGIIKDLLDVARINEGQLGLHLTYFSLRDAILEASEELFNSIKTHELILEGYPDIVVEADKFRIEQVLINLISNGIKYSPDANRIIAEIKQEDEFVRVSIRDFGIGIPKEQVAMIFERYFRVEQTSQNYSGMGLGLYISKGIIERHGGRMGVSSKQGSGSVFWFTIPSLQKKVAELTNRD